MPKAGPKTAVVADGSRAAAYRLAGRQIILQHALPELAAFQATQPLDEHLAEAGPRDFAAPPQVSFHRRGLLAGEDRTVRCSWSAEGCRLDVPQLGQVQIRKDGAFVGWRPEAGATRTEPALLTDVVLGPGLVLALALQGVWCLHASAVARQTPQTSRSQALAFLGASGRGKSTTAATLAVLAERARPDRPRLRLAGDDILPWTAGPAPRVLPHFPQLKYSPDQQPASRIASELPMSALYCLEPRSPETPGSERREVTAERLKESEAVLALVRHSVASTLFSETLLAHHFRDCAETIRQVPVFRLAYPKRRESLPVLYELLVRD